MYNRYQQHVQNPLNITDIVDYYQGFSSRDPSDQELSQGLFNSFADKYSPGTCTIHDCLLVDFPKELQLEMVTTYVGDAYAYYCHCDVEICKLIYYLWRPRMVERVVEDEFNPLFEEITASLMEFENVNTVQEYADKVGSGSKYYKFHLFAFFPLLGTAGYKALWNAVRLPYSDAQDLLLFGFSQYDPHKFKTLFVKILEYWDSTYNMARPNVGRPLACFISLKDSGTGIRGQLLDVLKIYKKKGVNLWENKTVKRLLEKNGIEKKSLCFIL